MIKLGRNWDVAAVVAATGRAAAADVILLRLSYMWPRTEAKRARASQR